MNDKKKSYVITTRLNESEYSQLELQRLKLKLTKSVYYRSLILGNSVTSESETKSNKIQFKKLLFLFNKASNNINQIAKSLNYHSKNGSISQLQFKKLLNNLSKLSESFHRGIDNVSKDK